MKTLIQTISLTLILNLNLLQISQLQAQCHIDDWTALKALYESTDGDNWTDNTGWEQVTGVTPPVDCDLGSMYGVVLDENGRVNCIDMDGYFDCYNNWNNPGNNLSGSLPIELGNLSDLTRLNLFSNELTGSIPSELGNLSNLTRLNLSSNELTGSILPELGNLSNLTYLGLSSNELIGSIPPELGDLSNLTSLWLSSNELTGSIPPELGDLSNLTELSLPYNNLVGSIPIELGNLTNLTRLDLYSNELSGSIPSELSNLINLETLQLFSNQLSGNFPTELCNLVNLNWLSLATNQLSGGIPAEITNLINLTNLHLEYNQFSGNIPLEIGNLSSLEALSLNFNELDGSIPVEIGNLTNLIRLRLSYNQLNGCYDSNLINLCTQLNPTFSSNNYISNGNNFDITWEDFCATGAGTCNDGVFPGDCNTDGIVNTEDALYWGLAEGFNGVPRPNATTDCSLQACPDWSQSVDGINSKHQDGDGNGTIDGDDLQVILSNFDCTNNYTAPSYASGAPIYRIQPQGINNDGKYQYDLYVENGSGAAAVAHGLAFTITSDVIPISAIAVSTTNSSLHPDEVFAIPDGNQCHAVLTRTDNFDVTCGGPIAILLVETNDIPTDTPFEIDITAGAKIKADATLDNITGASAFGMHDGVGTEHDIILDASVIHEQCNGLGEALVIVSGGTATPYTYAWSTGANSAQVNNLASGTYTVTVSDANGVNQSLTLRINGQTPIYDANGNLLCGNLCPEYLAPSGVTGNGLYSASNALNSDATIPTGNTAEYKAGQIIELKSGFKVQPNATFSAEIDDCQ